MNVRRFTARTSRDALGLVKQAFGEEAVVLSTRPCAEGVEVLAMASDAVPPFERAAAPVPLPAPAPVARAALAAPPTPRAGADTSPAQDAEALAMSTLSFQDYVRERMLRRRRAELQAQTPATPADAAWAQATQTPPAQPVAPAPSPAALSAAASASVRLSAAVQSLVQHSEKMIPSVSPRARAPIEEPRPAAPRAGIDDALSIGDAPSAPLRSEPARPATRAEESAQMLQELRDMKGMIEQRFGALAYLERLKRDPRQAQLLQRMLECGFSPVLTRRLADALPPDVDETAWAAAVLERNLITGEREAALEDAGGVYALIGPTGVGKTTSTAKLAAAFATRHGASNLGLITLDAYRMAAHEQLRAYGKILGVPVHTAHDGASLEDLLDLLSAKRMVLIDTAGMPQRDERTRELLGMLNHRAIQKLLVVNATAQGETIDDVLAAYRAAQCRGIVLSKLDEVVKLGPALDALIRHKLKVLAVANGQRVPEDWHRLSAATLVQRALRAPNPAPWKLGADDVSLVFMDPRHTPGGAS